MVRMLVLLTLVLGAWSAHVRAAGLPQDGAVIVLGDRGEKVGAGSLHDGLLEITLASPADRFVTLQIVGSDLGLTQLQGLVVDGVLYVALQEGVVPAAEYAARYATRLRVHGSATVAADAAERP